MAPSDTVKARFEKAVARDKAIWAVDYLGPLRQFGVFEKGGKGRAFDFADTFQIDHDSPVAKAFKRSELDPSNPLHRYRLLKLLAGALFPPDKRGRKTEWTAERLTAVEPFIECLCINVQDEDFIKKLYELLEISRTATEESGFVVLICCQPPYIIYIPNMMCMPGFGFAAKAFGFFASRWVSLVGQFFITVYGYVTAAAQLLAYRGFARAGDSLDKIISLTHCPFLGLISRPDGDFKSNRHFFPKISFRYQPP